MLDDEPHTKVKNHEAIHQQTSKSTTNPSITVSIVKSFLAGSLSGTCSALLFQPLDLVKTRLQSPVKAGEGRLGVLSVITHVLKQDKVTGLWKGLAPTVTRCVPGIGIYFSLLHSFKTYLGSDTPTIIESLSIGAAARTLTVAIMHPISVLKTRYESGIYHYRSVPDGLRKIYVTEGLLGLYSGLVPTLARDVPFSALYFAFYTKTKLFLSPDIVNKSYLPLLHFNCGILAGVLASILTQPADVVKTLMQLHPKTYPTIQNATLYIYQKEGLIGFQRGFVPRALRRCLMAAMAWTVYEHMMKKFGLET
ncbi:mitochondrial glycine transporter B [Octopus vulgaris]|nr:mitochondrial glycine transporter B [Octopus vulgaris]